jgi:DNA gyrase/topoisomerase IV subunit A
LFARKEIERLLQEIAMLRAEIMRLNEIIASMSEDREVMNQSAARAREVCKL